MNLPNKIIKSFYSYTHKVYSLREAKKAIVKIGIRESTTDFSVVSKKSSDSMFKQSRRQTSDGGYVLLIIPVTAFCLGTWQIKRKIWKDELVQKMEEISKSEPVHFPEDLEELKKMEYHPVRVRGKFDHSKEFLMGPRSLKKEKHYNTSSLLSTSSAGYWVITPFKLSDRNLTILVNRGWVPVENKSQKTRLAAQVTDEIEITGLIRLSEKRQPLGMKNIPSKGLWMYRDLEKMSEIADTYPIMIDADSSTSLAGGPIGGQTVINLFNNHLSYIFTWYGLSAVTSYMWYMRYMKGLV